MKLFVNPRFRPLLGSIFLLIIIHTTLALPTNTNLEDVPGSKIEAEEDLARQEEGSGGGPDPSGGGPNPSGEGPDSFGGGPDSSGGPPPGPPGNPDSSGVSPEGSSGPPPEFGGPQPGEEEEDEDEEEEATTPIPSSTTAQPEGKKKLNYIQSNRQKVSTSVIDSTKLFEDPADIAEDSTRKEEEENKEPQPAPTTQITSTSTTTGPPPSYISSPENMSSYGFSEQWAIVTGNITAQRIFADARKPPTTTTTTTESTYLHEWSAIVSNEEIYQADLATAKPPPTPSTTPLTTTTPNLTDFEREWNLVTADEVLHDPQGRAGCECGRVPFQVPGGGVNEWPWTAAIVRNGLFAGGRPHCGATLINSRYVLTAAHCVDGLLPYHTQVWLTVHDNLVNSGSSSGTLKMEVEKILMHPNYNRRVHENDLAMVALVDSVPISQSSYFVPACVPAGKNEYTEFVGKMAAWGTTARNPQNNRVNSNKMCKADMPILSNDICDRDTVHHGRITKNMLCAGFLTPRNELSCVGDAGGALIISNGGRHTLVGVTSFGYTPNRAYSPTVHTRVSEYAEWILHNSRDAEWCD